LFGLIVVFEPDNPTMNKNKKVYDFEIIHISILIKYCYPKIKSYTNCYHSYLDIVMSRAKSNNAV